MIATSRNHVIAHIEEARRSQIDVTSKSATAENAHTFTPLLLIAINATLGLSFDPVALRKKK